MVADVIHFDRHLGGRNPRAPASTVRPGVTLPGLTFTAGRRGEYAVADVASQLGMLHFSVRAIVDKLRALARHDGMPLPRTPRIVRGAPTAGPLVIYSRSRWDAGEFDAWLDGRGPAAPAAPLPAAFRDEMRRRAEAMIAPRLDAGRMGAGR